MIKQIRSVNQPDHFLSKLQKQMTTHFKDCESIL